MISVVLLRWWGGSCWQASGMPLDSAPEAVGRFCEDS